jgi:FG-GAP repeat protein
MRGCRWFACRRRPPSERRDGTPWLVTPWVHRCRRPASNHVRVLSVGLSTVVWAGVMGLSSACSLLVNFDGYEASSDTGDVDAAPSVGFKSYRFPRGAASFTVEPAAGLLLGSDSRGSAIVAGSFATSAGGGVEIGPAGGFSYVPPGNPGAYWGDDYFVYGLQEEGSTQARVRVTVQPDALRLDALPGSAGAGFGVAGAAALDHVGTDDTTIIDARHPSFAPAGDVNGDGLEDFIIGVLGPPVENGGIPYGEGRGAYVLFGKSDGENIALSDLAGPPPKGFAILDDANGNSNDSLGYSVSGAGDVNGDGLDDVVVGAHTYDPDCRPELSSCQGWGAAYVIFGKQDSEPIQCADLREERGGGFAIVPPTDGSYGLVGFAVAGAGDVNGDGLADLLVDVPLLVDGVDLETNMPHLVSAPHVVFGKGRSEVVHIEEVTLGRGGFAIIGDSADQSLGNHLAGVGDVNGDGLADVAVSSEYYPDSQRLRGRIAVVFGKLDTDPVPLSQLGSGSEHGFFIVGADERELTGAPVHLGDFNGDGLDDIGIGVPFASLGREPELAFIDAGAAPDPAADRLDAGAGGDSSTSSDAGVCTTLSCLGTPEQDTEEGIVYVVFGSTQPADVSLRAIEEGDPGGSAFGGDALSQHFGFDVSAGDFNGDGWSDIIATSPPSATYNEAYVVFGRSDNRPVALSGSASGAGGITLICEGPERACAIAASGSDVNGDGIDDLLVSSELYPDAPQLAGGAYVVFGWDMSGALSGRDHALIGTSADDEFTLTDTPVVLVRGGHGKDTLRVAPKTARLDLTPPGRYESLEVIDLRGGGPQQLVLDDAAVRRLPENETGQRFQLVRRLTVLGDAEDTLQLNQPYVLRAPNGDRDVYSRDGAHYGLEVSRAMHLDMP